MKTPKPFVCAQCGHAISSGDEIFIRNGDIICKTCQMIAGKNKYISEAIVLL